MKVKLAIVATVLMSASPAWAEDPSYFHKAGVSREAYMADMDRCNALAGAARAKQPATGYSPNIYATMATAFFSGLMQGRERRQMQHSVQRTCMADKGYSRIMVRKEQIAEILKLEDQARLDGLFALASAPEPIGARISE
ncbi:MAG: hypothetical protein ACKVOP_08440 [Sphingomonadaceae bacterium]